MKLSAVIALAFIIGIAVALPQPRKATECTSANCKLPNCRCASTNIPGDLKVADTPQFVLLTFDDAVTVTNVDYYREATKQYSRVNPDGCPSAMTFFLSHEYTDYSLVHELYAKGHEIALHSISHTANLTYWAEASVEELEKEFSDERALVAKFANIKESDIRGIRMPFLQMAGDNQFEMLRKDGFTYDLSWPTQHSVSPGLWPYTLDYASTQDCVIGKCPKESHKGTWVIPMIIWHDSSGMACSMVDTCTGVPQDKAGLVEFMKKNFHQTYKTNKAPIGFYTHAALFNANPVMFEAYKEFLDYLSSLKDVFMVGASDVINWIKNPKPVSQMKNDEWSKCRKPQPLNCNRRGCSVKKNQSEDRWFTACMSSCPNSYPWLGNKYGEAMVSDLPERN